MANNKYVLVDEDFQAQVLDMLKDINQVIKGALASKVEALPSDLMDTVDTMAYLKVSRRTLFKYRTESGLPSIKKNKGKSIIGDTRSTSFLIKMKSNNGRHSLSYI